MTYPCLIRHYSSRVGLALAVAGAIALALFSGGTPARATTGEAAGSAANIQGTVAGIGVTTSQVTIPANGGTDAASVAINAALHVDLAALGDITGGVTSGTVVSECTSVEDGPTVRSECFTRIENLSIALDVSLLLILNAHVDLVTATALESHVTCTSSGGAPVCTDNGTTIVNLCVLGAACINDASVALPLNIPGVASGNVAVGSRESRTTHDGMAGAGMTVTMLHVDLNLLPALLGGSNLLNIDIGMADAFLGEVQADPPASTPTPPPPPGDDPTPAPSETPAATETPGPTGGPNDDPTPGPGPTGGPGTTPPAPSDPDDGPADIPGDPDPDPEPPGAGPDERPPSQGPGGRNPGQPTPIAPATGSGGTGATAPKGTSIWLAAIAAMALTGGIVAARRSR